MEYGTKGKRRQKSGSVDRIRDPNYMEKVKSRESGRRSPKKGMVSTLRRIPSSMVTLDMNRFTRHRHVPSLLEADPSVLPLFHGGLRKIIGKQLIMYQMKYTLATIIKKFDISLVNPDMVAEQKIAVISSIEGGVPVHVAPRTSRMKLHKGMTW